jgi:RNA polymerase sigma-70 factor (ECF subfamily)
VLTEEQNNALWLYYVEDMPTAGIARVLGRSRASVKVLLFRARRRLLPMLENTDGNGQNPYVTKKKCCAGKGAL